MEKKSTKIAYFVALGIFVVLLAVLGVTFKDAPILVEGATNPFAAAFTGKKNTGAAAPVSLC